MLTTIADERIPKTPRVELIKSDLRRGKEGCGQSRRKKKEKRREVAFLIFFKVLDSRV
jgi:hypothetical protein